MLSKGQYRYILLAMGLGVFIYYLGNFNRNKHLSPSSGDNQGNIIYKSGFKEYKKGFVSAKQVLKNPKAYSNALKVQGVVGPVFTKDSIFFLSDIGCGENCASCGDVEAKDGSCKKGTASCCGGLLAVKLSEVIGKMPSPGDVVAVFGRVGTGKGGKLLVLSRKIRKLGTIGSGGKPCCQPKPRVKTGAKARGVTRAKQSAYSVKAITANPYSFTGPIKVKGIVKGVYPEKSMFGLVDFQAEQTASGCGGALIPVKYTGLPPSDNQCVTTTGIIRAAENGKLYMAASEIKKLDSANCRTSPQRI